MECTHQILKEYEDVFMDQLSPNKKSNTPALSVDLVDPMDRLHCGGPRPNLINWQRPVEYELDKLMKAEIIRKYNKNMLPRYIKPAH